MAIEQIAGSFGIYRSKTSDGWHVASFDTDINRWAAMIPELEYETRDKAIEACQDHSRKEMSGGYVEQPKEGESGST